MKGMGRILWALSVASMMGCSAELVDESTTDRDALREWAQAQTLGDSGKNDLGEDVCAEWGFYSDGVCDFWCAQPDEDCGPCDYPDLVCAVDEIAVDTNDTGCADTCAFNPDYVAPLESPLDGPCFTAADCIDEEAYCARDMGVCDETAEGVCTRKPFCAGADDFELDLHCGCDGITYANPCDAASAGFNLSYAGMCEQ